jgi:tRNA pseudouridine55 synthase
LRRSASTSGGGPRDGYLNVLKPPAMTSFDVVARVRAITGQRRVGHAGTLDPAAIGVLPIALGRATPTLGSPIWDRKLYWADVRFGTATDTDDAEGQIVATGSPAGISAGQVTAALRTFVGDIDQRPPAYSAIQVDGQRAYKAARRGATPDLPTRPARVDAIRLCGWDNYLATILVQCGSGTYIRSIARDLGAMLGCPAHLARLVRLRVGPFAISDALDLRELAALANEGAWDRILAPADIVFTDLPAVLVADTRAQDYAAGREWPAARANEAVAIAARLYTVGGQFLGLGQRTRLARWQPVRGLSRVTAEEA